MSQVTSMKQLLALVDKLEEPAATLGEELELKAEPLVSLYADTLPQIKVGDVDYRLTLDDADALRQHDANFTELFGTIGSNLIVERAKADKEIGALDLSLNIGNATFSTVFARPTGEEPTKKEWEASIGFGYGVPKSKALEGKIRKGFAASMMATDDEEDDE